MNWRQFVKVLLCFYGVLFVAVLLIGLWCSVVGLVSMCITEIVNR